MNAMKRTLAMLLASAMCLTLFACSPKQPTTPDPPPEPPKEEAQHAGRTEKTVEVSYSDNTTPYGEAAYETDLMGTGAVGANGAAVCASKEVTDIAVDLMKRGGNAIDAMVAMIYGVGLTEPGSSSIGGAGQMMIYLAKENRYLVMEYMTQAGEKAIPGSLKISRDQPVHPDNIAIPGIVKGTMTALEKYGKLSRQEVLTPIINLAKNGFVATERYINGVEGYRDILSQYDYTLKLFTKNGEAYQLGEKVTNPDLAGVYQAIADGGADAFYKSDLTKTMVDYIQSQGGKLTLADFAQYTAVERAPISVKYRDYTVYTVGGPSNGGAALLSSLNILNNVDLAGYGHDSWQAVQLISDATAIAYHDAMCYMADPDYYNLPIANMLDKDYGALRAADMDVEAGALLAPKAGDFTVTETDKMKAITAGYTKDSGGTTHLVAADSEGNWVSSTNTLGLGYGSVLAVPGTGFCFSAHLNNLTNSKGAVINKLQPYIRCRSTMCPSLIADASGKPVMATGSPGDWSLVSGTLHSIINYIDFDMDVASAVLSPRTWRDGISLSLTTEGRYSQETVNGLATSGFSVEISSKAYGGGVGYVAAIEKRDGQLYAIGDPRRPYFSSAY